jgi:hypothetical protein
MFRKHSCLAAICCLLSAVASATTFVVPKDDVLIRKAEAIVQGTVVSSYTREAASKIIETVTTISVVETLKGNVGDSIDVVEPGGIYEKRGTFVESSPQFTPGESVVLLLSRNHGHWEATDLALGAFHSRQGLTRRLLVRSEDIAGWAVDGSDFKDKARAEDDFIDYIRGVVRGHKPVANYFVDKEMPKEPKGIKNDSLHIISNLAASTYTTYVAAPGGGPWPASVGVRWRAVAGGGTGQDMTSGITYFKNSVQNLSGAGDGGVSVIQNALAAWTNDCGSAASLIYGGTAANLKVNDNVNAIIFNDPSGDIVDTFAGSGTIAVTFSNFNNILLINGEYWWVLNDADIVFQDGITNSFAGLATAMTHEVGHSIGFRHSNATRTMGNDSANSCNGVDEECTTTSNSAIMFWAVSGAGNGFTLQPWDVNAVRAVYPGSSCIGAPTGLDAHVLPNSHVSVSWNAVPTATSYEVQRTDNIVTTPFAMVTTTSALSIDDAAVSTNKAYMYRVRAVAPSTGPFSTPDMATVVVYANPTLTPGSSIVAAQDLVDIRNAANAVERLANRTATVFPAVTPGVTTILATDQSALRTAVNNAFLDLSLTAIVYTHPTPVAGATIFATDMTDLRNAMR